MVLGLVGVVVFGLFAVVGVVLGVVVAGAELVIIVAGCVVAGVETFAAPFPPGDPAVTAPEVGVLAGAAGGSVVIGVGTGGNGFDRMLAIISGRPSTV